MSETFNEIKAELSKYLFEKGIQVLTEKLYYKKELKQEFGHDVYKVTIGKERGKEFSFEWNDSIVNSNYGSGTWNKMKYFKDMNDANSYALKACFNPSKITKPRKELNAAEVLYGTFEDSGSFTDFCSSFGYDPDSRKALDIYMKRISLYDDAVRVIGRSAIEEINEILNDY